MDEIVSIKDAIISKIQGFPQWIQKKENAFLAVTFILWIIVGHPVYYNLDNQGNLRYASKSDAEEMTEYFKNATLPEVEGYLTRFWWDNMFAPIYGLLLWQLVVMSHSSFTDKQKRPFIVLIPMLTISDLAENTLAVQMLLSFITTQEVDPMLSKMYGPITMIKWLLALINLIAAIVSVFGPCVKSCRGQKNGPIINTASIEGPAPVFNDWEAMRNQPNKPKMRMPSI